MKKFKKIIISILICQLAGVIGSFFTRQSVSTWYQTLRKPFFTPPSWLFAPAWTTLFLLMGIALYLVWEKGFEKEKNKKALFWFSTQLILNILWSAFFFGLRSPIGGLIEIIILWGVIFATIQSFYEVSKKAAYLLVPYFFWTSFALILNFSIFILNF